MLLFQNTHKDITRQFKVMAAYGGEQRRILDQPAAADVATVQE